MRKYCIAKSRRLASALGRIERELRDSLKAGSTTGCAIAISAYLSCADSGGLSKRAIGSWLNWKP
jgi:hypothetical protein